MNKQKLYFYDSYINEFEADIIDVIPYEDNFGLILDKTYFYPESGGQPADTGTINGEEVIYVTEKNDYTLHIVRKELQKGHVHCKIDWDGRFDNMQQHTGQHILSYCFYKLYHGETSSFHIGKDSSTIEIDVQSFDHKMAEQVEEMSNCIIYNNSPITASIVDKEGLAALSLRKQPKVDSEIRIIDIENCDCTPCGGTHVKNTGEVGMIKIKKIEKLKSSYKFEFVCGKRALKDYTYKNNVVNWLGAQLSSSEYDVESAYLKFSEEHKNLQKQLSQLKSEIAVYEVQLLRREAVQINQLKVIIKCFDNKSFNDIKLIAQSLASEPSHIALLANSQSCQLIFSRSENVEVDMNALLKGVLPIINGKGGGSARSAQGGGTGDVQAAVHAAFNMLKA